MRQETGKIPFIKMPRNIMDIETLLMERKARIIDVRTPHEFQGGHVMGSENFPLGEISARIEELKENSRPLVLCCASGTRSAMATQILTREGLECYNGGSWLDVNYYQSQNLN